jgi:hypothetical protein
MPQLRGQHIDHKRSAEQLTSQIYHKNQRRAMQEMEVLRRIWALVQILYMFLASLVC